AVVVSTLRGWQNRTVGVCFASCGHTVGHLEACESVVPMNEWGPACAKDSCTPVIRSCAEGGRDKGAVDRVSWIERHIVPKPLLNFSISAVAELEVDEHRGRRGAIIFEACCDAVETRGGQYIKVLMRVDEGD